MFCHRTLTMVLLCFSVLQGPMPVQSLIRRTAEFNVLWIPNSMCSVHLVQLKAIDHISSCSTVFKHLLEKHLKKCNEAKKSLPV